ncbi:MAG: ammonium transporter [Magnetovibrionaceae bacterium]
MSDPDLIPALNILWIVISTGLVLIMQGGFMCLETGLTRSKNSINVALKNMLDLALAILVFWAVGYGLMFGASWDGLIGTDRFFALEERDSFHSAFFLFQALFCGTAVTIVSGAVAERLSFRWYLIISAFIAGVIYPTFGHWAWNGLDGEAQGWLALSGFVDWAGSTVVHSVGGWFALALLIIIGPREGRFNADGEVVKVTGSNLPMVALGALLLWFGWFGFNAGSTLAVDQRIGLIAMNTSIAAAAGGVAALLASWMISGRPRFQPPINGLLAGLVAITAGCHAVGYGGALIIGAIGGLICMAADEGLLKARIDDAVGAVPVHLAAGIWGTLAVGIFGQQDLLGTGLPYVDQILIQAKGVLLAGLVGFVVPLVCFSILNRIWRIRVGVDEERIGLNVSEHGARTELFEFVSTLTEQERTGDIRLRAPEEPFTEIGQIGGHYNRVMESLQQALTRTDAIVRSANDAILIVEQNTGQIQFHNPVAERLFGYTPVVLENLALADLVINLEQTDQDSLTGRELGRLSPRHVEVLCRRRDARTFPAELTVSPDRRGNEEYLIVTIRDITQRKKAEAALKASEARFRAVYQHAAFGLGLLDTDGSLIQANPALAGMLATRLDDLPGKRLDDLVHTEDLPAVRQNLELLIDRSKVDSTMEARLICKGGVIMWARILLTLAPDAEHDRPLVIALVEDITRNRQTSAQLRLAASVFEGTQESIVIFNATGEVERVNRSYSEASGYEEREVAGLDLSHLSSARYAKPFFDDIRDTVREQGVWQGEIMIRRKSGELIPSWMSLSEVKRRDGAAQNLVGIITDLSERKEREEAIWRTANFDQVTNLPNRRLFNDRLSQALGQAARRDSRVALFFLDLDRFKAVNDTLGHQAGDVLLATVAKRLQKAVRATDTVARLGGDEFTVIVDNVEQPEDLSRLAQGIIAEVNQPVTLPGGEMTVSTSIGIAVFPDDGESAEDLIRNADAALYHAKDRGRDNFQFFTDDLKDRLTRRIAFERNLNRAIGEDRLIALYQPQIDIVSGKVVGAEALARWQADDGSLIAPDEFISLAEETGQILDVGRTIIQRVARDMTIWGQAGVCVPRIAINVSARQFTDRVAISDQVEEIFHSVSVPLEQLGIEITESSLMTDRETTMAQLVDLWKRGVKVSLDDFGKGYSSLSRLKNLPIQALKMDKDFVDGLPDDAESLAMASAIISMARGLGIDVVAEGVERNDQAACLKAMGCHVMQGFLYARPMTAEDFLGFVQLKAG